MVRSSDGKVWYVSTSGQPPRPARPPARPPSLSQAYPPKRLAPPAPTYQPYPPQQVQREPEKEEESSDSESSSSDSDTSRRSKTEQKSRYNHDPAPDYSDSEGAALRNDQVVLQQSSAFVPVMAVAPGPSTSYQPQPYVPYSAEAYPAANKKRTNFEKFKAKLRAPKNGPTGQQQAQGAVFTAPRYDNQVKAGPSGEGSAVVYSPYSFSQQPNNQDVQPDQAASNVVTTTAVVEQELPDDQGSYGHDPPGGPPGGMSERPDSPVSVSSRYTNIGTVGPVGFNLAYVDFIPQLMEPAERIQNAKYETMISLMSRANNWLSVSPTMKPMSFETVTLPFEPTEDVDSNKALYELKRPETWHLRVLRMWVACKDSKDDPDPVKVDYINLYPKWSARRRHGRPAMPVSETLDETAQRLNEDFAKNFPLVGQVLSMETVDNLPAYHKEGSPVHLDPDTCICEDNRAQEMNCLTLIRIYYTPGDPGQEIYGLQDFVPELTADGEPASLEPFEDLVRAASSWVTKYKGLRVTNLQSIKVCVDEEDYVGGLVNTRRTLNRRVGREKNQFVTILRVYYTQRVDNSPLGPDIEDPRALAYNNFLPAIKVSKSGTDRNVENVESMSQTMQKMLAWFCLSGQKLICVQTICVRGDEDLDFNAENSYSQEYGIEGVDKVLYGFRIFTDPSDIQPANSECTCESKAASLSGSVRSRDYSAWTQNEIPKSFLTIDQ